LAVIVLLPVVTFYVVPAPAPTSDMESVPGSLSPAIGQLPEVYNADMLLQRGEEYMPMSPAASWRQRAKNLYTSALPSIVFGWLIGVFALSLWHLGGWAHLQRLKRKNINQVDTSLKDKLGNLAERLKVTRPVKLMKSALVQIPTVVGCLRPVILLPASALTGLSSGQLEAVLAHELAHIYRYDYLVNMLQTVVEIVGFYHPAVWWISHKMRIERENCCDDLAVSVCGDKVGYARALTLMEETRLAQGELVIAASGGNLFTRISRLVGNESARKARPGWAPVVLCALLIIALAIPTTLALTAADSGSSLRTDSTTVHVSDLLVDEENINSSVAKHSESHLLSMDSKVQILFECKIYEMPADLEIFEGKQEEKSLKGRNLWLGNEYAERLESLCRKSKKAKLLANPRILVLEGEEASMNIVHEIPYKAGYESATEVGTGPKPIVKYVFDGIDLKLKGHTVDSSTISTEIRLTQSKTTLTTHKDGQGREIQFPVVASSVCTTDVTVPSQTPVVIGGLKSQNNDNSQLLLVITPSIMHPEKGIESQVTIAKERRTIDNDPMDVVEIKDAEKEKIKADQRLAELQNVLEQDEVRLRYKKQEKALEQQAAQLQQLQIDVQRQLEDLEKKKAELESLSTVLASAKESESERKRAKSGEELKYHTVREGETLSSISEKYYGSENKWQKILDYNREIITADGIRVGQQLIMPPFQVSAKEPESEHERFAVTAAGFAICDDYAKAIEHIEKAIELAKAGKYYGIGIAIEKVNGLIRIVQVLPDTPASGSSFRPGDIIKAIDGLSTESMSLNEVVAKIVGPEGTKVTLTVKSHNRDITMKETFTRQLSLTDSPAIEEYQRRFDAYKAAKTGDEYLKTMQRPTASTAEAARIFELKYAGAEELAQVLNRVLERRWKGMSDKPAQVVKIVPDSRTNRLIILASPADIQLIEALIAELDVLAEQDGISLRITPRIKPKSDTPSQSTVTEIIALKYADCESVAQILQQLISDKQLKIVPDKRTNMLLVAGTETAIKKITDLVAAIDIPGSDTKLEVNY
ncbi:MAG: secretin N-terminal domain-containing protein, partial [Sedimentisphaerales bacterium]